MKLTTVLLLTLLITAATQFTARAQFLTISVTGTISSNYAQWAGFQDSDVLGQPATFTLQYDPGTAATATYTPDGGTFYPTFGTWTLTTLGGTNTGSYTRDPDNNFDNGIQVLAKSAGDSMDGFILDMYSDEANSSVTATFQSNTALPNEDLSNVQTLLANFSGTASMQIGDSDSDILFGVDLTSFSIEIAPEPSTWAMLAGGLGLVGLTLRRRGQAKAGN